MKDVCKLCKGLQNLFCLQNGEKEWYTCVACGGAGVRAVGFPHEIKIGRAQMSFMRPVPEPKEPIIDIVT